MADLLDSATFSQTDASNTATANGAIAPSNLDNGVRQFAGAVTREANHRNFTLTSGGSADAQTLTFSVAPAALTTSPRMSFIAGFTNTTTVTLNVNSLGAKTIKRIINGTKYNLLAGEIVAGQYVDVKYDGTDYVWLGPFSKTSFLLLDGTSIGTSTTYVISSTTISRPFSELRLHLNNGSHNNGSSRIFQLELSGDNSSTYSSAVSLSASVAAATDVDANVFIQNAAASTGNRPIAMIGDSVVTAVTGISVTTGHVNAMRLSLSGAGNFDSGLVSLVGIM